MKKSEEDLAKPPHERHPNNPPPPNSENGKTKPFRKSEDAKTNLSNTHSSEVPHRIDDEQTGSFPSGNEMGQHIPSEEPW